MNNIQEEDIGKAFKWQPTGAIFLCISWDLETWAGVCIKGTPKGHKGNDKCKIGEVHSLNADSDLFEPLPGQIEFEGYDTFDLHKEVKFKE